MTFHARLTELLEKATKRPWSAKYVGTAYPDYRYLSIPELWSLAERQLIQNKKRQPYATLDAWFNDTQLRYALLKEQDRPLVVVRVDSLAGLALLSWSHNGMPYVRKGA